jgi:hypothetical protein
MEKTQIDIQENAIRAWHDLDDIQAYAVEAGAEYTIRDYTVSIYKDKEADSLSVEVTGHLFETEKPIA